jgi:uncharacterized membrane protein
MLIYKETKTRSIVKSAVWRLFAFLNSWGISWIVLGLLHSSSFFLSALAMNVTGFIIFYLYERVWNKINKGRYVTKEVL